MIFYFFLACNPGDQGSAHGSHTGWNEMNTYPKHRRGPSTKRCSIWACFGASKLDHVDLQM